MLDFFRFVFGYIKIKIYGESLEKIINSASKNGILLWNIEYFKDYITVYMKSSDFKNIRKIRNEKGQKIKIVKKYGLPFFINRHRSRIGFAAGVAVFLSVLITLSQFLWIINIKGNIKVSDKEILNCCDKLGIKIGTPIKKINSTLDAQKLLLDCEGLAWASLNIEGSKLTVNVTELEDIKKEDIPCNIVASEDGVIKKIDITSGTSVVKVGDIVKKGDILVSGIVENMQSTVFTHSSGEIIAEVDLDITAEGNFVDTVIYKTGKSSKKSVFHFFGLEIPLFLGDEKELYNSKTKTEMLNLFNTEMPIGISSKSYIYLEKKKVKYEENELKEKLLKNTDKILKKYGDIQIINENTDYITNTDGIILSRRIKCNKNIGVKKELLLNTIN